MKSREVARPGSFIRVFEQGQGPLTPILLVSGFIGTASFWQPIVADLSRTRRVISFDQRGTGTSGDFSMPLTMEQLAQDALAVLAETGSRSVHVIGHSAGAGVAITLAARHPDQVASLTLIGGWTRADMWMRRVFEARLDSLDAKGALAYLETTTLFMRPPTDLRDCGVSLLDEEQRSLLSFPGATRIRARAEAVLAWDSARFTADIRCPTLVMGSADDWMTPFYLSEDLAREIPGATLHRLEQGGHYGVRSRPQQTLQPMLAFLAQADSSSSA